MGKRKVVSEIDFGKMQLPVANDGEHMAIEVPVNDYFHSKCFICGYGFHALCKILTYPNPFPDPTPDIVMCTRLTKECKFTPVIKMDRRACFITERALK